MEQHKRAKFDRTLKLFRLQGNKCRLRRANQSSSSPAEVASEPEALTVTELNQRNSPLLRLPGEVRNMIYDYVFGGLVIEKYSSWLEGANTIRERKYYLWTRADRPKGNEVPSVVPFKTWTSALLTCSQIYLEASLLPFQLNHFRTHPVYLHRRVDQLTLEQREAITTIQLRYEDAVQWTKHEAVENAFYPCCRVLRGLTGLELVVAEVCSVNWGSLEQEEVIAGVRHCSGRDDLKVIFKDEMRPALGIASNISAKKRGKSFHFIDDDSYW